MPTVTVPRDDLSTEEVATVLRDGLGEGYNVLPGMAIGQCVARKVRTVLANSPSLSAR